MHGAGRVVTNFAIPTIAVSRDPRVQMLRQEMNARDKQDPRDEIPARQSQPDACQRIYAGKDATDRVDGLHQAHGFRGIHLREAGWHAWIMEVEELDAAA